MVAKSFEREYLALLLSIPWLLCASSQGVKHYGESTFRKVGRQHIFDKSYTDDANLSFNNPFSNASWVNQAPKRPCKRLFTSVDGENVLAQVNRDTGKTRLINFYDKPFVNGIVYDFQDDAILGMINGTILAEIGHRQAHVRIRGPTDVEFIQSMVVSSYGELIAYSPVNTAIYTIDKSTGEATSTGETGIENLVDMAYWFQGDLLFVTDGELLFAISVINLFLGDIGPITGLPDGQRIASLVMTPQGTLFGVTDEFSGATVYELDKFSGRVITSRAPVSSSLISPVSGGTLRCPLARLPSNAFPPREPTPGESWSTDIDLTNVPDSSLHPAFEAAKATWDGIITRGGIPQRWPGGVENCEAPDTIDDLFICAEVAPNDGPRGVLGFAGPWALRGDSLIPYLGAMFFDSDDIGALVEEGLFDTVVRHEMAHVYGLGSLWTDFGLSDNFDTPCSYGEATHASEEYQALSGCTGVAIPLENDGGRGTACGHWDEECFTDELMTGFSGGVPGVLSRITIAGFEDLGYEVDYDLAEPYDTSSMSSSCLCQGGGLTEPPPPSEKYLRTAKGYRDMIAAGKAHLAKMSSVRETWEASTPESNNSVFVADKVVHVLWKDENGVLYEGVVRA